MKEKSRPVSGPRNIGPTDLLTYSFPITAIASITHRVAGAFLFFSIGLCLGVLHYSLESEQHFNTLIRFFSSYLGKAIVWVVLAGLSYHFVAGIKHLIMDFGIGETLEGGTLLAKTTVFLSVSLMLLAGIWLAL
ncbi:MAG: succinate dehydrogenase, cytochrome b556 subunit [Gammaproteobacteria bacterium]|nr:succinate dehydrogenase, cytochrome b556 subunit [Gammaproteobacteria bacterium]